MTLNNDRETNQTDKQINRLTQTDGQTEGGERAKDKKKDRQTVKGRTKDKIPH